MDATTHAGIKARLASAGALQANSLLGGLSVCFELACIVTLGCLAVRSTGWEVQFWVCEVLLASSMFRMFVLLHECGHRSLFRGKRANDVWGHIISPFCLLPYLSWRDIHALH